MPATIRATGDLPAWLTWVWIWIQGVLEADVSRGEIWRAERRLTPLARHEAWTFVEWVLDAPIPTDHLWARLADGRMELAMVHSSRRRLIAPRDSVLRAGVVELVQLADSADIDARLRWVPSWYHRRERDPGIRTFVGAIREEGTLIIIGGRNLGFVRGDRLLVTRPRMAPHDLYVADAQITVVGERLSLARLSQVAHATRAGDRVQVDIPRRRR